MSCWCDDAVNKENLQFDYQSKQVDFFVCVAVFCEETKKNVLSVSIKFKKHKWKFGRTWKSCGNTTLALIFLQQFLFLFLKYCGFVFLKRFFFNCQWHVKLMFNSYFNIIIKHYLAHTCTWTLLLPVFHNCI